MKPSHCFPIFLSGFLVLFQFLLLPQVTVAVDRLNTRRLNPRTNALELRSEDVVDAIALRDIDYDRTQLVVFQVPEYVETDDDAWSVLYRPPSEAPGRIRSENSGTHEDSGNSQTPVFRSNSQFMREARSKDPNDDLFRKYGFTYLGRFSLHLPDFHVISRNISDHRPDDTEAYTKHLEYMFGAKWISSQTKQPRPLRQLGELPAEENPETESTRKQEQDEQEQYEPTWREKSTKPKRERTLTTPSPTKRRFDSNREARKTRTQQRKLEASLRKEETEAWGQNLRQSALRRNALSTIHPNGPAGRSLLRPWTSRRLQSIHEDLRNSYAQSRIPSDPLVKDQWFLHGGDYAYPGRRVRGIPIPNAVYLDVVPAWQSSDKIDGRGVVISVVDDGVNFLHSDLKKKFIPMLSHDFADPITELISSQRKYQQMDEYEREELIESMREQTKYGFPLVGQTHGTSVASIAAGSPSDGTCGTGVAPGAMLSSVRVIGIGKAGPQRIPTLSEIQEALSLSYRCIYVDEHTGEQKMENMIYVISWGPEDTATQTPSRASPLVRAAIQGCSEYGRRGHGSIYVMGAGNGKELMDSVDLDGYASSRYVIAVGAISRTGYPTRYSEAGESLLVVAPGGDNKRGITAATTAGAFFDVRMQSIARMIGNDNGKGDPARGERFTQQDDARTGLGQTGCTNKFAGTSASASMIGGVISMMLQANPDLSWKDVQDILIQSCEKPHFGERKTDGGVPHHAVYREAMPIRLAQERGDESFLSRHRNTPDGGSGDEDEVARLKGDAILNQVKSSMYIFFAAMDGTEWVENYETGLHHSRVMGFGIPNVTVAVAMSKVRGMGDDTPPSITNDYAVRSHNLVENMVHYGFTSLEPPSTSLFNFGGGKSGNVEEAEETMEEAFLSRAEQGDYYVSEGLVRQKEIAAWHVVLDPEQHPVRQIYDFGKASETVAQTIVTGNGNDRAHSQDRPEDHFVMEHVELYVNATMPASIANSQIALCDRTSLCSLFVPGMAYSQTQAIPQTLDYTFTSVKYWGQTNPYDGGWVVMMRNIYPSRVVAIQVHELTLTVYGHYQ
jgi:subtilisin family serine protease